MELYTILTALADNTSCGYHRVILPMQHLGISINKIPTRDQVLYFNRVTHLPYNNKFILDLDDYWHLPNDNPHYNGWMACKMPRRIERNIKNALLVTTTNEKLASKILPLNKNVEILPNALPFDKGQFTRTKQGKDFVFAGGVSHIKDIELISHIPNVKYYGGLKGSPHYPLDRYMKVYDNKLASLVSLHTGEFNECKSNLKILEAGAKGIGCIASAIHPYFNDIDKEVMFYGFDKLPSIKELQQQGIELAKHVRKHYHLNDVNKKRKEIFGYYLNKL